MKIILILLLHTSLSYSQFRETEWGMTKKQVKAKENSTLRNETDDELTYDVEIANITAWLYYLFVDNQLCGGGYNFLDKHTSDIQYINDYYKIKDILIDKFDQPAEDDMIWENDLYKDDPDEYGPAVSLRHLIFKAGWKTEDTEILLILDIDQHQIGHDLFYLSPMYMDLYDQRQANHDKNDF